MRQVLCRLFKVMFFNWSWHDCVIVKEKSTCGVTQPTIGTGPGRKIKWRTDVFDDRDLRGVGGERLPEAREAKPAVKSCWTGNDVLQRAGIDLRAHRLISLFIFLFHFLFPFSHSHLHFRMIHKHSSASLHPGFQRRLAIRRLALKCVATLTPLLLTATQVLAMVVRRELAAAKVAGNDVELQTANAKRVRRMKS